ncbi:MAG: DUF4113 domain-containing protein [Colwellia sp.]|nr:DUF4113 domain-containing protein [Colwellia sp.]
MWCRAIELESRKFQQADLFSPDNANPMLMNCLDSINKRYGQGTLTLAAEGQSDSWQMQQHFLSPKYTSNWQDISKISC